MSPAKLMYGRRLWSQIDQLHPDVGRKVRQSREGMMSARSFVSSKLETRFMPALWLPGEVVAVCGSVSYSVALEDGRNVHRHTEQLRSRTCRSSAVVPGDDQVPEEDVEGFDVGGTRNVLTGGTVTDSVELIPSTNQSLPVQWRRKRSGRSGHGRCTFSAPQNKISRFTTYATADTAPTSIICTDYACARRSRCVRTCILRGAVLV